MEKITLSTTLHETVKIPDFILLNESRKEIELLKAEIKNLNIEKGKQEAEIDYLNSVINNSSIEEFKRNDLETRRNVKKEQIYIKQREELNKATLAIGKLKSTNGDLICEIIQLKKKLGLIL